MNTTLADRPIDSKASPLETLLSLPGTHRWLTSSVRLFYVCSSVRLFFCSSARRLFCVCSSSVLLLFYISSTSLLHLPSVVVRLSYVCLSAPLFVLYIPEAVSHLRVIGQSLDINSIRSGHIIPTPAVVYLPFDLGTTF